MRLKLPREAVFAFSVVGAGFGVYHQVATVCGYLTVAAVGVAAFLAGRHAR